LSVIDGGRVETTKPTDAESPVGLPVAVIVYAPAAPVATLKAPANVPSEIVQLWEATAPPDNEQLVSDVEKPEPVTCTVVPVPAELGFKVIVGVTIVRVVVWVELVVDELVVVLVATVEVVDELVVATEVVVTTDVIVATEVIVVLCVVTVDGVIV